VRDTSVVFRALLASDELDLVRLVEIETSGDPIRYALDAWPRVWSGATWAATAGGVGEIQESAEREAPALQLVLQNADGILGARAHPDAGGEDLRGRRVTIWTVDRRLLEEEDPALNAIAWRFWINRYTFAGREALAFDLDIFPAAQIEVPNRTLQGLRCRWVYRGAHCAYVGDLPACAFTVADCALHFVGEPLRFGGYPTSADARALRII
jgi:phage-related protein